MKKLLLNVVTTDLDRTQGSDEANNGSYIRKEEKQVDKTMKLNDESDERLEFPPIPRH